MYGKGATVTAYRAALRFKLASIFSNALMVNRHILLWADGICLQTGTTMQLPSPCCSWLEQKGQLWSPTATYLQAQAGVHDCLMRSLDNWIQGLTALLKAPKFAP